MHNRNINFYNEVIQLYASIRFHCVFVIIYPTHIPLVALALFGKYAMLAGTAVFLIDGIVLTD